MPRSITSLLVVGIALLAMLLIACSGEATPEPTPTPSPTATLTDTQHPSNTPEATEVATTEFTAAYGAFCSDLPTLDDLQFDDDSVTYGQVVQSLSEVIATWEAVDPPTEAAAWHNEMLEAWASLKAVFDAGPGDSLVQETEEEVLAAASIKLMVNISRAEGLLARDARNAMVSAGCLGIDGTPDNHGNEQTTATMIAVGEEIEGSLNYLGDTDYFVFAAEAGTSYQIDLYGDFGWAFLLALIPSSEENYADRTSQIVLYDSAGMELQSAELSLISITPGIITWEATVAGDYYISLGDWEIGDYTLSVNGPDDLEVVDSTTTAPAAPDDHANDTGGATVISVGTSIEAVIDYRDDVDYFRFTAEAGRLYEVDVALGTLGDSNLSLRDSNGDFLTGNDDYGETYASRVIWVAPVSGDYYIEVSSWDDDDSGSYTLTVSLSTITDDHGNDDSAATAVSVGTTAGGSIDYAEDMDYFRFTAEAGQLYEVDVALGTLEDSNLMLLDSNGDFQIDNDDYGDSLASRVIWVAPVSGDYYAAVSGVFGATGSYTLTVSLSTITDDHGNDDSAATAVSVGTTAWGSIDYAQDVDYFRFTAEAGQLYEVDVALGTLEDSNLTLLDSNGDFLIDNDDYGDSYASRVIWLAPVSGDYYIEVSSWDDDDSGSYTLTVAEVP